jgi:hypothetical protein
VFNETEAGCGIAVTCPIVNCDVKYGNGLLSPYGTGKNYFALCVPGTTEIKMFKCPKGVEFNSTPNISSCVYRCTKAGKFPYKLDAREDNRFYYECESVGGKLVGTLKKCESGEEFASNTGHCEPTY